MKKSEICMMTLIVLMLLASFSLASYLAYNDKSASATVSYGFSGLCLFLLLLSRFKKIEVLGASAEMWDDKQYEAAKLVETMKSALISTSSFLLNSSARVGRWSGPPRTELLEYLNKNTQVMKDAGFGHEEIRRAQAPFFELVSIDLIHPIVADFNKLLHEKSKICMKAAEKRHPQPITNIEKFNVELEECRKIGRESVDWNDLFNAHNAHEILNMTLQRLKNPQTLTDTEREELINRHGEAITESNYINRFGKFENSTIWTSSAPKD